MRKGELKEARENFSKAVIVDPEFDDAERNIKLVDDRLALEKDTKERSMTRGLEAMLLSDEEGQKCPRCEAVGSNVAGLCTLCGYIFHEEEVVEEEVDEETIMEDFDKNCPSCGFFLGDDVESCPACEASLSRNFLDDEKDTFAFLLSIPGIGPQKADEIIRGYGSIKELRKASLEDLSEIPGVSLSIAKKIKEAVRE